jgi:cellulose synthase/poly-beta-1,6-N-acetylglucosamine synthase-like glycosyltransferase
LEETTLGCTVLGCAILRCTDLATTHLARYRLFIVRVGIVIWVILVHPQITSHSKASTNAPSLFNGLLLQLKGLATVASLLILGSNGLNGGILHAKNLNRIE